MNFASDNSGPVAPQIMQALAAANEGYAKSYGTDTIMDDVRDRIRTAFEAPDAAVYLVATGTAANALALSTFAQPWDAIFAHRTSHIEEDECGAPEFYAGGAKMLVVEGDNGKMTPGTLARAFANVGQRGVHSVQKGPVSLTQTTELGTVYSVTEITALATLAHDHGAAVHLDGARFANALVSLGCSPAEMTWKAGVDVVSFGGTKNGLMGVEGVIIFDPAKAWEFELRRKRGGHLFSKHRFLSAQMQAYLTDGLWLDLAGRANAAAAQLEAKLTAAGGRLIFPRQANMIFAEWSRAGHNRALDAGASYYTWPYDEPMDGDPEEKLKARLVCNWSTTDAEIDAFCALIRG